MKIHRYAHRGDIAGVQQELERGVSIDLFDTQADFVNANLFFKDMTPLQCALASPLAGVDMVKFLYDRGAKRSIDFNQGNPDMYWAIQSDRIEKIQLLLDLGADLDSAMEMVIMSLDRRYSDDPGLKRTIPVLQFLEELGVKLNDRQMKIVIEHFWHSFYFGNNERDPTALLPFLVKTIVKLNDKETYERVLLGTCVHEWFEIVRMLVSAGYAPANLKWTDLMQAVVLGTITEVETLLEKGTDINASDDWGYTAWLLSVGIGDVSKAQQLLVAGANPLDSGIARSFKCAVASGNPSMLAWLSEIGLNLDAIDDGETVALLGDAIEFGNISTLALLIELGLNVNATDKFGDTAVILAVDFDRADALSMLLAAGAIPVLVSDNDENCIRVDRVRSAEVLTQLLLAGETLTNIGVSNGEGMSITPSIRSLLTKVEVPDEWELDPKYDRADKQRRFGQHNPEEMEAPFWREMVKFRWPAYVIHHLYREEPKDWKKIWCFHRFGQSMTLLPDGRVIEIAGEHEDAYDPDFCIYNDVVVYDGLGDFQIYGYPKDVFPPTDSHTATWVDGWIYIIGNIGYEEDRIVGETPVYRLNCTTFEIEPVITTGECPSWIGRHRAVVRDCQIHISGGKIDVIDRDKPTYIDNQTEYILDLNECCWYREKSLTNIS